MSLWLCVNVAVVEGWDDEVAVVVVVPLIVREDVVVDVALMERVLGTLGVAVGEGVTDGVVLGRFVWVDVVE